MRIGSVEIYSDATNAAVMRHPGRTFPGVLIQGDTLYSLVRDLQSIQRSVELPEEASLELADICERLNDLLLHYKAVLTEHSMKLPFHEPSGS